MAITLRGYASATVAGASTCTCNVPAGVQDGDVLIAQVAKYASAKALALPAGWTELYRSGTSYCYELVCWRIASSEPANYGFQCTDASNWNGSAIISAWTGVNTASPINTSGSLTTPIGKTPSVLTTVDACVILSMCLSGCRRVVYTAPVTITSVASVESNSGSYSSAATCLGYFTQAAAGNTGDKQWSPSISADYAGCNFQIALAPAPTGEMQAAGASTSTGTAVLGTGGALVGSGAGASTGTARLNALVIGSALLTQLGAQVDVNRTLPMRLTQAGAQVDLLKTVPIDADQVSLQTDLQRTSPLNLTQAGLQIDVSKLEPLQLTAAALQIDGRLVRESTGLNCWEVHVEDRLGRHLALLENAFETAYMDVLSDCGSGKFKLPAADPKATSTVLAAGNVVKLRYRNRDIGAWIIENLDEVLVDPGEGAAKLIEISGRGLLSTLGYGIVYPSDVSDPTTAERAFSAVTPAGIFLTLYQEFVARGGGWLTPDFYPATDSAGAAWPSTVTRKFRAGQKLLEVARQLAVLGLELTVDPDKTLRAWVTAGADRSTTVIFRHGYNLLQAKTMTAGGELANAVLGEGQDLFLETEDTGSLAAHGRREYHLQVGNTADSGQVGVANSLLLTGYGSPLQAIQVQVTADPFYPFFDYGLGDVVRVVIPGKIDSDYRVLSISVQEGQDRCDLRVTLELNSVQVEYLAKLQRASEANLSNVNPGAGASSHLATSSTGTPVTGSGAGLAADAIKDVHIDWGTGAGQVSAVDIPIADAGGYYSGSEIEAALQQAGSVSAGLTAGTAEYLLASGARAGGTVAQQSFTKGISIGGLAIAVRTETANYTVGTTDNLIVYTGTVEGTITLPVSTGAGQAFAIMNAAAGTATVAGAGGDTINAAGSIALVQWQAVQVVDYAVGAWVGMAVGWTH